MQDCQKSSLSLLFARLCHKHLIHLTGPFHLKHGADTKQAFPRVPRPQRVPTFQTHTKAMFNTFFFSFFFVCVLVKTGTQLGYWEKNGKGRGKKCREVRRRRRVVKITLGCHPGPGLCGNEGLEATLLLPDAVRPLRSPLMHGPSHQDFSIPSRYTLPHTLMCAHTRTRAKTRSLLTRRGRCKKRVFWLCPTNDSDLFHSC